jgi:hypothetical protein
VSNVLRNKRAAMILLAQKNDWDSRQSVKDDGLQYKSGGGGVNTSMEVKKRTGRGTIASREQ